MRASQGEKVGLPNVKAIFPYLGLFTLVTLDPDVIGDPIPTLFEPPLSIIRGETFAKAHSNASPTDKNVARIFAPLDLVDDSPRNPGVIPISPDDQTFNEKRYWRLPVPSAHIFAALIGRLQDTTSKSLDIKLADIIHSLLKLQHLDEHLPAENAGKAGRSNGGGGGGPNDDNKGDRGSKGGGRTSSKRKRAGGESEPNGGGGGDGGPNDDNKGGRGSKGGGGRTSSKRKRGGGESGASPSKGTKKARKTQGPES